MQSIPIITKIGETLFIMKFANNKNVDIKFNANDAPLVSSNSSGITFIRYAQNRKIGRPNNLKPNDLNRIV
jgi:hypothetical protein